MNERIHELAKSVQCERHWTEEDIEKFAELIVRECINWSIKNKYIEPEFDAPTFTKELKNHFGVEERTNDLENLLYRLVW